MIGEQQKEKYVEKSDCSPVEVLSLHFSEGTGENMKNLNHRSWCRGQDLNQISPECKSRALLLCQPAQFHYLSKAGSYVSAHTFHYSKVGSFICGLFVPVSVCCT
jgi:hypothetical protein